MGFAWALVVAGSCHLPCGAGITPSTGCRGGSPARGWVPSQNSPQAIPPAKQGPMGAGDKFWAAPHHLQSLPCSWGPLWELPCLVSGMEGSAAPEAVPALPPLLSAPWCLLYTWVEHLLFHGLSSFNQWQPLDW